jgi:hypothetical protein
MQGRRYPGPAATAALAASSSRDLLRYSGDMKRAAAAI